MFVKHENAFGIGIDFANGELCIVQNRLSRHVKSIVKMEIGVLHFWCTKYAASNSVHIHLQFKKKMIQQQQQQIIKEKEISRIKYHKISLKRTCNSADSFRITREKLLNTTGTRGWCLIFKRIQYS